jgi:hypothetical protein
MLRSGSVQFVKEKRIEQNLRYDTSFVIWSSIMLKSESVQFVKDKRIEQNLRYDTSFVIWSSIMLKSESICFVNEQKEWREPLLWEFPWYVMLSHV